MDLALRPALDAFGLISMGAQGSCTGTHIGNGYVITAGHCFLPNPNPKTNSTPVTSLTDQACDDVKIDWGYRGSPETGSPQPIVNLTSQCTRLLYAEHTANLDFAIFKVNSAPSAKLALATAGLAAPAGTKITLFGYPNGNALTWSQSCSVIPLTQDPSLASVYSTGRFLYQCDTEPGESGSALLTTDANGNVTLVGIHNDAAPQNEPYNIGTDLYALEQSLLNQGINLPILCN